MYIMWICFINECVWHPVANVRRVCVLQVGKLVMVDRHVVREFQGTCIFYTSMQGYCCTRLVTMCDVEENMQCLPCLNDCKVSWPCRTQTAGRNIRMCYEAAILRGKFALGPVIEMYTWQPLQASPSPSFSSGPCTHNYTCAGGDWHSPEW